MERLQTFPFIAGQHVESKSKIKGFRGAWFRSEIKYIQVRKQEIWCAMNYTDFPDEKMNFMKAYQQVGKGKRVLMIRPAYPTLCMAVDDAAITATRGAVVVISGDWCIGDLVDWFSDGCFWAAKITDVKSKEIVQIELPGAPLGEGGSYEAAVKDIRPSPDWSVEQQWTVSSVKSSPTGNKLNIEDKGHIYIAKQEPPRTSAAQVYKTMSACHEEEQMKKTSLALGSEPPQKIRVGSKLPQKFMVSDAGCPSSPSRTVSEAGRSSSPIRTSQHTNNVTASIAISTPPEPFLVTVVEEHAVANCPLQIMDPMDAPSGVGDKSLASSLHFELPKTEQSFCASSQEAGPSQERSNHKPSECPVVCQEAQQLAPQVNSSAMSSPPEVNTSAMSAPPEVDASAMSAPQVNASAMPGEHARGGRGSPLSTINEMVDSISFEDLDTLLGDREYLDPTDKRVGSAIEALEELVTRVVWLKGVVQHGLTGWKQERKRKKWMFCEADDFSINQLEQDVGMI